MCTVSVSTGFSFRVGCDSSKLVAVGETPKSGLKGFKDFEAADEADYEYYRSLTGNERLKLMLAIMGPAWEANPRFERVYRIIDRNGRVILDSGVAD
jgi:hypothetical protein